MLHDCVYMRVCANRKQVGGGIRECADGMHFKGESNEEPWLPKIEIRDGDVFVRRKSLNGQSACIHDAISFVFWGEQLCEWQVISGKNGHALFL